MLSKMKLMSKFIVTTIVAGVICTGILTYINIKRQKTQMLEEVRKQARAEEDQLVSTRKVIAEKQKAINTDSKGNFEFKDVIPAIVGREVAEHFSQTTILQEQSEGINQISTAVSTMDTVTQQNADNAEELAAPKARRYCPVVLRS